MYPVKAVVTHGAIWSPWKNAPAFCHFQSAIVCSTPQVACSSAYTSTDKLEVQKTWWECSPELYAAIALELMRLQSGMAFAVLQQGPTSCSCSDAALSSFILRIPTLCVVYRGVTACSTSRRCIVIARIKCHCLPAGQFMCMTSTSMGVKCRPFVYYLLGCHQPLRVVQIRNLKKKLQQIEALEARRQAGQLDPQQHAKLAQRAEVCAALQALQDGASLEEAHKLALAQRALLPAASASSGLNRSPSTLSMDSLNSNSKHKGAASKHKAAISRAHRQSLTEQPKGASHTHQDQGASAAATSAVEQGAVSSSQAQGLDQAPAELTPARTVPTPKAPITPVTQLITAMGAEQQTEARSAVSNAKPCAWGSSATASSPVASLRVSGFDTPLGQKAEGTAWASPAAGSFASAVPLSSSILSTPPSSGAAKKMKPPRKGGLSMFLSGDIPLGNCCFVMAMSGSVLLAVGTVLVLVQLA